MDAGAEDGTMKTEKSMIATVGLMATILAACPSEPEYPVLPPASNTVAVPPPVVSSAPPAPVVCDGLSQGQFTAIFAQRQTTEAPGMKPEGAVVCGNVQQGQKVEGTTVLLQPGMCYTVLANALPNVTELNIALVADATAIGATPALANLTAQPLAVDSETGPMSTIGAKTACYRPPIPLFPIPAKLVITAAGGSGPVGAQIFSKKAPGAF